MKRNVENDDILPFSGVRIKAGQFIYSRIWARKGAVGIVPSELENAVVTSEFPVFDIDVEKVEPIYLLHAVLDSQFLHQIELSSLGSTSKQRIKENIFLSYYIALPTIEKHRRFVIILNQIEKSKFGQLRIYQYIDKIRYNIYKSFFRRKNYVY